MRQTLFLVTAIILCGLAAIGGMTVWFGPEQAHIALLKNIKSSGFENAEIQRAEYKNGRITLENIFLDKGKFSLIKNLEAEYSLFNLLARGKIDTIKLNDLELTGEIDESNTLSIAGLTDAPKLKKLIALPVNRLELSNARLSLLTPELGGITIDIDLVAHKTENIWNLAGKLSSKQPNLALNAHATGQIIGNSGWSIDLELDRSKFDTPDLKMTRVNGWVNLSGRTLSNPRIMAEIRAGSLVYADLPWRNAEITLNKTQGLLSLYTNAQASGFQGISLDLDYEQNRHNQTYNGTIAFERAQAAYEFLDAHQKMPIPRESFRTLKDLQNLAIDFYAPFKHSVPETAKLTLRNTNHHGGIDFTLHPGRSLFEGEWKTDLERMETFIQTFDPKNKYPHTGYISLGGRYTLDPGNIAKSFGNAKIDLRGAHFRKGHAYLDGISGQIKIDNLRALSAVDMSKLTCTLPLRHDIPQNCEIYASIKDGEFKIDLLRAEVFGGALTLRDLHPFSKKDQTTITLTNIDLGQMTQAMNMPQFKASGSVNGKVPIEFGKNIRITDAQITSAAPGAFHLYTAETPSFFAQDPLEKIAMRNALEDYRYDQLELRLTGENLNNLKTLVSAYGLNPDLFEGRKFGLNFHTQLNLFPSLDALARQGGPLN